MLCPLPVYLNICVLIASCILARSDNGLQHQSYQSHCQPIFAIYLPFISRGLLVCEDLFLGVGVKPAVIVALNNLADQAIHEQGSFVCHTASREILTYLPAHVKLRGFCDCCVCETCENVYDSGFTTQT